MAWKDVGAPRLDALLKARALTNGQVARLLGVDPSLVSRFRNGRRVPDADQLAVMVGAADGSVDDVLGLRAGSSRVRAAKATVPQHLVERLLRDADRLTAAALDVRESSAAWKKKRPASR